MNDFDPLMAADEAVNITSPVNLFCLVLLIVHHISIHSESYFWPPNEFKANFHFEFCSVFVFWNSLAAKNSIMFPNFTLRCWMHQSFK